MNSHETAILQLLLTRGIGQRTLDRVLQSAAARGEEVGGAGVVRPEWWQQFGLKPTLAQAVAATRAQAEQCGESLEGQDIFLLIKGSPGYPERLSRYGGEAAPAVLFGRGARGLLDRPAVAFCGSRKASAQGLTWTGAFAARLAEAGVNVVSGYANGIDLEAHRAALAAGGGTTLVLAEGILRFAPKPEVAELLEAGRHLILSEFAPRVSWSVGNAMQRNGTIRGLSDALVVVESGLEGGTFAAGKQALAEGRPLFVVDYPVPPLSAAGNRYFLQDRGRPLPSGGSLEEGLAAVLGVARGETVAPARLESEQRSLFED